jgi:plastocyanin
MILSLLRAVRYSLLLPLIITAFPDRSPLHAQSGPGGEIRGKITITRKGEPRRQGNPLHDRYSTHGAGSTGMSMAHPETSPAGLSERAVVYLESSQLSPAAFPPPEKNPTLDQRDLQFRPQVLPILAGTAVDFPNRDNLFHNVFSYSHPREFDLGRYPKDDSRSVRFDLPGVVRVYCDIHSQMNATILVLSNPYFATPADDGTYVIKEVPEGKYSLVFWYDRDAVERRRIEVRNGESIEANFSY